MSPSHPQSFGTSTIRIYIDGRLPYLNANGNVLHTDEVTIGIRSVELKDGYYYLNGEPVRLVGITRHADYPGKVRPKR